MANWDHSRSDKGKYVWRAEKRVYRFLKNRQSDKGKNNLVFQNSLVVFNKQLNTIAFSGKLISICL